MFMVIVPRIGPAVVCEPRFSDDMASIVLNAVWPIYRDAGEAYVAVYARETHGADMVTMRGGVGFMAPDDWSLVDRAHDALDAWLASR